MAVKVDIYRKLQRHLDRMPIGYPSTETGVELKLLKFMFTPEQAKITTLLDYRYKSLDEIYESASDKSISDISISRNDLKRVLDDPASSPGQSHWRAGPAGYLFLRTLGGFAWHTLCERAFHVSPGHGVQRRETHPVGGKPRREEVPLKAIVPDKVKASVLDEFISALKEEREPECSGRDNLKTMAMTFAAFESARNGRRVSLSELMR